MLAFHFFSLKFSLSDLNTKTLWACELALSLLSEVFFFLFVQLCRGDVVRGIQYILSFMN